MSNSSTPLMNWLKSKNVRLIHKQKTNETDDILTWSTECAVLNSPITALALNIEELSTANENQYLRRKLLSNRNESGKGFCRQESLDEGCSFELPVGAVDISNLSRERISDIAACNKSIKKMKSLPLSFYGFLPIPLDTPKVKRRATITDIPPPPRPPLEKMDLSSPHDREDESSQDSGVGLDKGDFKVPPRPPLSQLYKVDITNATPQYVYSRSRARMSLFRSFSTPNSSSKTSPQMKGDDFRNVAKRSDFVRNDKEDEDDGFIDLADDENTVLNSNITFSTQPCLKSGKIQMQGCKKRFRTNSTELNESSSNVLCQPRRNLFSQTNAKLDRSKSFCIENRTEPNDENEEMCCAKRLKGPGNDQDVNPAVAKKGPVRRLVRSHSEAMIKSALVKSDEHGNLIGDFSRSYSLPLSYSRHQDLKAISSNTMAKILNNEIFGFLQNYLIIDCRYPYEFDSGHLKSAKNIYSKDGIVNTFFSLNLSETESLMNSRPILIFHCEFSSERGPKLMRLLRGMDRECNKDCYPALHYPEMYLLEGGYKAFFEKHSDMCEPCGYKPMVHEDHVHELKSFRSRSRSRDLDVATVPRSLGFDDFDL